jgi:hypothetical protein
MKAFFNTFQNARGENSVFDKGIQRWLFRPALVGLFFARGFSRGVWKLINGAKARFRVAFLSRLQPSVDLSMGVPN